MSSGSESRLRVVLGNRSYGMRPFGMQREAPRTNDGISLVFSSSGLELPRINYAHNGKPYRYIFAAEVQWSPVPTKVQIPVSRVSLCRQTGLLQTQLNVCKADSSGLNTGVGNTGEKSGGGDSPEVRVLLPFVRREP